MSSIQLRSIKDGIVICVQALVEWKVLFMKSCVLAVLLFVTFVSPAAAAHRVMLFADKKVAIVEADGTISWEMPWTGSHDLHQLADGTILLPRGKAEVCVVNPETKEVVWSYKAGQENGNAGKKVEVHAAVPVDDGNILIAESGSTRLIEVNRDGQIVKEIPLKVNNPHPHRDTRLVRKLENGHYLVCHEGDGTLREYDENGHVTWEYEVPMFGEEAKPGHGPEAYGNQLFSAIRLPNGHTLIGTGNGHRVIEVTPDKKIVWQLDQNELPGITFAWITTLEVLPDGNYVIGNCHAGPGQPVLVEIEPETKKVVWQLDKFDVLGNSVTNSMVLDVEGSLR